MRSDEEFLIKTNNNTTKRFEIKYLWSLLTGKKEEKNVDYNVKFV